MRTIYSIILFLGTLSGCTKKAETIAITPADTSHTATMPATDSLTYLALGDSYTIGQSVPPAESFPFQLAAQLNGKDLKVKTPKIIATTGWITDQLIAAINNSDILNKKYDFVTLLIGVNDQFGGYSQANYRTKFVQVLNTAITFANGDKSRVFVLWRNALCGRQRCRYRPAN
jgi:lysophospholipase L1-like esterase